jgi:hypothetical protein
LVAIKVGPPTQEAVDSGFDHDKMIDYQKQVMRILDTIAINPIGRVITDFILKHKRIVSIEPLYKSQSRVASVGEDNATTGPVRGREQDSAPKGASERGPVYWYAGKPDSIYTRGEDERDEKVPPGFVGTGAGSDVVVNFTPANIKTNRVWDRRADNVLVHELVHALRVMQGLRNPIPTKNSDWMNEEEFWACVVQDVYLSAGGSTRLRYGYGDYESLMGTPLNTSSGFLAENLELFTKHATSWGQVYTNLAMVNTAPFNPFRQYVVPRM